MAQEEPNSSYVRRYARLARALNLIAFVVFVAWFFLSASRFQVGALFLIACLFALAGLGLCLILGPRKVYTPGFLYGCSFIVLLFLLAGAWAIMGPSFVRAREFARRARCAENLENIYSAIEAYRQSHQGEYPPTLQSLVEAGLLDAERLHCPGTPAGSGIGYEYFPPAAADTRPATQPHVLVRDRTGNHGSNVNDKRLEEGRNVLYANGNVNWVDTRSQE